MLGEKFGHHFATKLFNFLTLYVYFLEVYLLYLLSSFFHNFIALALIRSFFPAVELLGSEVIFYLT